MAVQKMQDYIRAHLTEKIGLAELAQQAQFSPWYCYRLFQAHTGLTPARYIRRLRLAEAALQLKNPRFYQGIWPVPQRLCRQSRSDCVVCSLRCKIQSA